MSTPEGKWSAHGTSGYSPAWYDTASQCVSTSMIMSVTPGQTFEDNTAVLLRPAPRLHPKLRAEGRGSRYSSTRCTCPDCSYKNAQIPHAQGRTRPLDRARELELRHDAALDRELAHDFHPQVIDERLRLRAPSKAVLAGTSTPSSLCHTTASGAALPSITEGSPDSSMCTIRSSSIWSDPPCVRRSDDAFPNNVVLWRDPQNPVAGGARGHVRGRDVGDPAARGARRVLEGVYTDDQYERMLDVVKAGGPWPTIASHHFDTVEELIATTTGVVPEGHGLTLDDIADRALPRLLRPELGLLLPRARRLLLQQRRSSTLVEGLLGRRSTPSPRMMLFNICGPHHSRPRPPTSTRSPSAASASRTPRCGCRTSWASPASSPTTS